MVFHGYHRNAPGYRDYARKLADRHCMLIVSPLFEVERFPQWRYSLGSLAQKRIILAPEQWTGHVVLALIEEVRKAEGRRMAYTLFGHSGGGQFLMRLAATVPHEARRIVIANPGALVWAYLAVKAPYGLGELP